MREVRLCRQGCGTRLPLPRTLPAITFGGFIGVAMVGRGGGDESKRLWRRIFFEFLINSLDYFELVNNTNHLISYKVANVRAAEDGVGILLQLKLGSKIDFATPRQKGTSSTFVLNILH